MTLPLATLALTLFLFMASIAISSPMRAGKAVAGAGILTASWTDIRIVSSLTVSDLLLVVSVPLLLAGSSGRTPFSTFWRAPRSWLMRFAALVFAGGLAGGLLNPSTEGAGFDVAVRFAISISVVSIVAWLYVYDQRQWMSASLLFVLGVMLSTVFGVIGWWDSGSPDYGGRAVGLTIHPNHFGLSALVALPLALPLSRSGSRHRVWGSALALAILGFAVVSSGSRAALIGAAIWLVLVVVLNPKIRVPFAVFAGLPLVVLATLLPNIVGSGDSALSRLFAPSNGERQSSSIRTSFYQEAGELFRDSPIIGQGFANALRYHSVPLQVAVTAGLLGIGALIFAALGALRLLRKAAEPKSSLAARSCAAGVAGTIAMLVVSNQLFDRYLSLSLALMTLGVFEAARVVEERAESDVTYMSTSSHS